MSQPHSHSPPPGPLSAGPGAGVEAVGEWGRVCGHRECHVTRGGGGARSQRLLPSPRVQVSPTRVPDSLVLPSLGAESAHGPELGLSTCGPVTRTQECVERPGLSEGPASGFTQATHSRPLAAQEPSSSFKVLGWGCLHSLKSPRRHCTERHSLHPQRQNKASPLSKGLWGCCNSWQLPHPHTLCP